MCALPVQSPPHLKAFVDVSLIIIDQNHIYHTH